MGYEENTYKLLQKLNYSPPMLWEVPVYVCDNCYSVQFYATEAEMFSALLDLNEFMSDNGFAFVEYFLSQFDVSFEDMQRCYAMSMGWAVECFDCSGTTNIGYNISHKIENNQLIFVWEFDPRPVSCINDCLGIDVMYQRKEII